MGRLRAHVVAVHCEQCRDDLLIDCNDLGLPLPTGEFILIPCWWANKTCYHGKGGLALRVMGPAASHNQTEEPRNNRREERSARYKDVEAEIEAPDWRNNLDASKDIGYPAREYGLYGSYPAHDGFDDESRA